jgi:ribosomal protein S16
MLKIKLIQTGRKGARSFKAVVQQDREKSNGTVVETLATFTSQPLKPINIDRARIDYWLRVGAIPTPSATKALGK